VLFTKRSKSASLPCHQRPPSPNYKTRSTISAPTTTPPGPTERGTGAAPCRHSLTDPRPSPPATTAAARAAPRRCFRPHDLVHNSNPSCAP
jgi:hypothetical protein